ncbi:MAG: cytochrome c-type biogenesis protein CcmH [Gammaproteobacteria bacterium]|nr:MAG: cytochrome c-type biogenesis protein CcmH [Gammaproteobacteria bacterium]
MGLSNNGLAAVKDSILKIFLVLAILLCICEQAFAAIETHEFDSELQRQRYQSFIEEMRCPKCQNQNLAGSDSPISADLRRELYEMIKQGKSDKEIVDFMVDRYGDFILYRPRVAPVTYVLWGAPITLLIVGIIVLIIILRRRRQLALIQSTQELSAGEQARLNVLLESAEVQTSDNKSNKYGEEPRS